MLGRLLNTAASSLNPASYTSRNATQLESVTEEEHTSGLLFPDATLLRRSNTHAYPLQTSVVSPSASSANSFDDRGGLEIDPGKDFRVIIAQNALGDRDEPCVLLDTQNLSPETSLGLGVDIRGAAPAQYGHTRHASMSKGSRRAGAYEPPLSVPNVSAFPTTLGSRRPDPGAGAFSRARYRSSTFSPSAGEGDYHHNRGSVDSNDMGLLNCIFGSSAFSYRGSSTKMHILPVEGGPGHEIDTLGARGGRHRAPLSRAHTSGPLSSSSLSSHERANSTNDFRTPVSTKVTVLVTRMFSVNLPDSPSRQGSGTMDQSVSPDNAPLFGSRASAFDAGKRKKIKEKKTPMYAVAITVDLPLTTRAGTRPSSQWSTNGQDQSRHPVSASLDSDHRWGSAFGEHNPASLSTTANLDDRIDMLVDQWDVITRTLSHLEKLATKEILTLLKRVDSVSMQQPKPAKAPNMQRTNQTIVQLPANILSANSMLRAETSRMIYRISSALRIPRVITGQSRWGVWREEARWIARYLSNKEHNFFFLVLITAFLGNHTEWLSSLGPDWYKRRHQLQQRAQQDAEPMIPSRTVIISPDKMTARRLIFVLSAFLPAQQRSDIGLSSQRPGTSTSLRTISRSPPNPPISRQESLRRTINRRARARQLTGEEQDSHKRSASASSSEAVTPPLDESDFPKAAEMPKGRRDSDVRSIRTASLPIPSNEVVTRKSAAATTATAEPGTTTPVPHFTQGGKGSLGRKTKLPADINGSAASANLLQNLRRSESSNLTAEGTEHPPASKWNILSGFWGPSSNGNNRTRPRLQISNNRAIPTSNPDSPRKLSTSTAETAVEDPSDAEPGENVSIPPETSTSEPRDTSGAGGNADELEPSSPVKLTVGLDDGVIDVEVPLPGFVSLSSSGDSTLASPRKTRTSITSLDGVNSFHSGSTGFNFGQRDYDGVNINVAGWLKRFHEDFLLQAVHPYNALETDIKRAMAAEPSPPHIAATPFNDFEGTGAEKWVDVCTTLIADTRTYTLKRLRLRRKISARYCRTTAPSPTASAATSPQDYTGTSAPSQFSSFFANANRTFPSPSGVEAPDVEETIIEEPVMDLDGTLVDAVERVLAQSGQSSLAHSRAASPNRTRKGKRGNSQGGPDKQASFAHAEDTPIPEIPRGECRKLVLGALEEVVRSVTAERHQEDGRTGLGVSDAAAPSSRGRSSTTVADNTLREGIRKWLLDVEEAC